MSLEKSSQPENFQAAADRLISESIRNLEIVLKRHVDTSQGASGHAASLIRESLENKGKEMKALLSDLGERDQKAALERMQAGFNSLTDRVELILVMSGQERQPVQDKGGLSKVDTPEDVQKLFDAQVLIQNFPVETLGGKDQALLRKMALQEPLKPDDYAHIAEKMKVLQSKQINPDAMVLVSFLSPSDRMEVMKLTPKDPNMVFALVTADFLTVAQAEQLCPGDPRWSSPDTLKGRDQVLAAAERRNARMAGPNGANPMRQNFSFGGIARLAMTLNGIATMGANLAVNVGKGPLTLENWINGVANPGTALGLAQLGVALEWNDRRVSRWVTEWSRKNPDEVSREASIHHMGRLARTLSDHPKEAHSYADQAEKIATARIAFNKGADKTPAAWQAALAQTGVDLGKSPAEAAALFSSWGDELAQKVAGLGIELPAAQKDFIETVFKNQGLTTLPA